MPVPILPDIVRQHAEQAAFLWTVYDAALRDPGANPDMDEERIARVRDRLEAHIDGLRVAGAEGREIAASLYEEYPEAGELFVLRMLQESAAGLGVAQLDLDQVRLYLAAHLPRV